MFIRRRRVQRRASRSARSHCSVGVGWCIGTNGSWRADGDPPADDGRTGPRQRTRLCEPTSCLCLTHVDRLRARMAGLARQGDDIRQCPVGERDRSICRPAGGGVRMLATRPVLAYFSITHSHSKICGAIFGCSSCVRALYQLCATANAT